MSDSHLTPVQYRQLFESIVNLATDGLLVTDISGRILMTSRSLEMMLKYERDELVGRDIRELIPLHLQGAAEECLLNFLEVGVPLPDSPVNQLAARDGSVVDIHVSLHESTAGVGDLRIAIIKDLGGERRLLDDLERQRTRLKAIVDTAVDGIITIDERGHITFVNNAVEALFGYPAEELLGKNVARLMPEPYRTEHDSYLENYHNTGIRKIIGIGREVRGLKANGDTFPIDLAVSESHTRQGRFYTGIIHDLTARAAAEDDLKQERALFKAVLDHAPEGVVLLDEDGQIMSANPASAAIFGMTEDAMRGRSLWDFVSQERETGPNLELRHGMNVEVFGRRQDGSRFPLEFSLATAETSSGRVLTAFMRDISERRRLEQVRLEKEAAERANAAKSEFLSRMSHELRTPLNAVIGYSQLLSFKNSTPEVQEGTSSILKAGRHLLSLINEVLDLASIDAGRFAVSLEPVQVSGVILQAIELLRPIAESSRIDIKFDPESWGEEAVLADRQRLLQVFINLISNAVKYNRPGGSVTIEGSHPYEGKVRISVSDTGVGIHEIDRERLFQPFERLGTQVAEGSGLGLVLSRRFVELMGGALNLVSSSPQGSCFAIDLRQTVMPTIIHQIGGGDAESYQATFDRQIQILYIEDNSSNMKLMEMILAEWSGVTMIPAIQGQIGLEIARSHMPDLVLLDLHLPDMQGEQVLRLLKSDADTGSIPVIVVSADATHSQIRRLMAAGADDYVTKPIDIRQFTKAAERLLKPPQ